ncbi:MAG: type II CAAX endopeptidase family protein [Oxalicibacterium faecigallinarum]|uniref:CPBP family intramembrane glutamic endopeptidase n=1 Tax=Oxalicibacterium faecigallinarum TaxID=573741 RepID=UPI002806881E|nr:type II CAAX endopeptidase family protein [Oxalicibacterium faecigallinarum]MDQ7969655.1 type II CAAX endopeptidase family protein [Oxalicibacterium faecigallinarum]
MTEHAESPPTRRASTIPGWPEIIAGLVGYALAYFASPYLIDGIGGDEGVVRGLVASALSGLTGLVGFFAALLVRRRGWRAFGVRAVGWRWLALAVGLGLVAFILARTVYAVLGALGALPDADPQQDYRAAAGGGALALVLQLLFIAVLTPIGEEFLFRGVLVSSLRRYSAVLAIAVSTMLFLVAHGLNLTLLPAALVGILSALLLLRTGSIWPGVVVHGVNNGIGTVLELVLRGVSA